MTETRKLAAIPVADVVGYSRLAGADEDSTLARLRELRSGLIDPTIADHNGRIVKRTGDGSIIEFRSVVDAVRCAIEIQSAMIERNLGVMPEKRIEFRVSAALKFSCSNSLWIYPRRVRRIRLRKPLRAVKPTSRSRLNGGCRSASGPC